MKQEDKQFLAELAKELNTQDNAGTANPVWCIMDKEIVFTPDGNGDFLVVAGPEKAIPLEDFADEISEEASSEKLGQEVNGAINLCTDTYDLREVLENYTDKNPYDYTIYDARKEDRICRYATGFLTKKSAEEHLKQNAHHYSKDARAYALSALRNPVFEKLIRIIKTTNWEEYENEESSI